MNKLKKVVISTIAVVILTMSFCMTNVYAVSTSLEDFIKTHNVENMSKDEITNTLANIQFDNPDKKQACINQVGSILSDIDKYTNNADKLKRLDEEFASQAQFANSEADTFFLYYGYALGMTRVEVQRVAGNVGDMEGASDAELQKKFNISYDAFMSIREKDYETAKKCYDYLTAINNQIKDKKMQYENLEKIDEVYTYVVNSEPTQGDLDNDNGGSENVPPTGLLGNADASAKHTPDEIIGEAQNFRDKANAITTINGANLEAGSSTVYNILLSIGIFLAVAIGMYLGVKFMLSNAEDKAKVKEALIPYIAGCVVIFSAFIIWKVAILLLSGIK